MKITPQTLYDTIDATWPCANTLQVGPFTIRDGQGGGKRVSAATAEAQVEAADLPIAEEAMARLDQPALFMIRSGETELDSLLDQHGYRVIRFTNRQVEHELEEVLEAILDGCQQPG